MITKIRSLIFTFLLLIHSGVSISESDKPFILLNHASGKHVTIINQAMVRQIFTLQHTRWPNGDLIHVKIHPIDSPENNFFVAHQLSMPTYRYKQLLDSVRTTPNEYSLEEVLNQVQMLQQVKNTINSIGYANNHLISNDRTIIVIEDVPS
jgi:hypothetical protein